MGSAGVTRNTGALGKQSRAQRRSLFLRLILPAILPLTTASAALFSGCVTADGRWRWDWATGHSASRSGSPAATSPVLQIERDSQGYDPEKGRIALAGAINETLTFELRIRLTSPIGRLNVTAAPLVADNGHTTLPPPRLYRLFPIRLSKWPGWHIRLVDPRERRPLMYDVVVPVDAPHAGFPANVDAGETVCLFGEFAIPDGTPGGTYSGQIGIYGSQGLAEEIHVRVTVWPFQLPAAEQPMLIAQVDHDALFRAHLAAHGIRHDPSDGLGGLANPRLRPGLQEVLHRTVELLRSHGVTPLFTGLHPPVTVEHDQTLTVDWKPFDDAFGVHWLNPQEPGPRSLSLYRLALDDGFPLSRGWSQMTGDGNTQFVEDYLRQWADHFARRGWLPHLHVDASPYRPAPTAPADNTSGCQRLVAFIKETVGQLTTRCDAHFNGTPQAVWNETANAPFERSVDIWCPPARFCDPAKSGSARTWVRPDDPPYSGTTSIYADEPDVRALTWQAVRYAVEAVDLGPINRWPDLERPQGAQTCIEFDNHSLIYPGAPYGLEQPVASMRLKWLRRGMDDMSYVLLLRRKGLEHVAESIMDALAPYAFIDAHRHYFGDPRSCGWARDPRLWEQARRIMADELLRDDGHAVAQSATATGEPMIRWRRFMSVARSVSAISEGVRIRPTRVEGIYRVECTVRIENRRRVPLEGHLSFAKLPAGWNALEPETVVGPIPPMGSRRLTLVATAERLVWGPDGLVHLPLLLRTKEGHTHHASARLACLMSNLRDHAPNVDGDLSDWTVGPGNVAAGFAPITGHSAPSNAMGGSANRTRCIVSHDRNMIYLGIYCAGGGGAESGAARGNSIRYDGPTPVEGDLVEVLIDPTNAATHDPADLLHIVVKRCGIAVLERGASAALPSRKREIWPAHVRYAVSTSDRGWAVEMAIPRDAVASDDPGSQIWGLNLTRFEDASQEYETWSGALRNAYDPASLGNLIIP